jgi:hypothetical protein
MVRVGRGQNAKCQFVESGITGVGVPPEIRIEHLPDAGLEHCHYTKPRLRKESKLKIGLGSKLYPSLDESCGHRTIRCVCYCISYPNERERLHGQSESVVTTSCGPALQPAQ